MQTWLQPTSSRIVLPPTDAARVRLEQVQSALESARQSAQAPSFAQGVGTLMGAPSYQGDYVFPVGGGPQLVSVVLNAWHASDPRCGIGMTIRTEDEQVWTYCHLAFLEPSVTDGVSLSAGTQIGLVGSTGHATGPHLHLQLQPATSYPQSQAWFERFAGKAFRWQDAPTELELPGTPAAPRVFSVVPVSRDRVVGFTRGGA